MTIMTRRRFGKTILVAGGLAASPLSLGAAPRRGGHLRLGLGGANTGSSLDPATWGTGALINMGVWAGVYNNLFEIGADGSLTPELAESAEVTADARIWTFRLREGVEFHDGRTLTSADVVASINHHRGPESKSAAKVIVDAIESIEAPDTRTVVVTLKQGNADFAYLTTDYHLPIGPSRDGSVDWGAHVGTGGYSLAAVDMGVRIRLERAPNYWKEGHGNFDSVELLGINDATARLNAMATGEVDAINSIEPRTVSLLARNPRIVIEEATGTQHYTMPMWADTAPFSDPDVRLAMKLAVDREEMVEKILFGHGRLGNDTPITPANRYFAEGLEQRAYDPDRARSLLRKAGMEGLEVTLHAADAAFPGATDTAILYAEQAARAGITVNVEREPNDGYWSNVWTKVPFCMSYWGGRPTEDWMFSQVYASDASWNDTHWKNERFDRLLIEARVETDEPRRAELYAEMQALVRDDGGAIVPMYANYIFARDVKVARGETIGANWSMDGWKAVDRWWMT